MRRIIGWLVRLYPAAWRQRYGAEFDALLEQVPPNARSLANVLGGALSMHLQQWSFGKLAAAGAITGALLGTAGSFAIQPQYVSRALLQVATLEPSTPQIRSHLVADLVNRAMTREALSGIARRQHLDPNDLTDMMKSIMIKPASNGRDTFTVQFRGVNAIQAQKVAQEVVAVVIDENIRGALRALSVSELPGRESLPMRIELLRPATLPTSPDTPRLTIAAVGLLLGGAAAFVGHLRRKMWRTL